MGSAAQRGLGATFRAATVALAEVTDISEYGISRADLDVTNHDSSGNAEEFLPGLITGSEISVTCNTKVGDTGQAAMITYCANGTTSIPFLITLPNTDASTFAFLGYVKSYRIKADLKGIMKTTFVVKISHAPTWTV